MDTLTDRTHSPILVVAAVSQELAPFRKTANGTAACLLTGMGQERARASLSRWLAARRCRGIIATGFAGAAQDGFRMGDLLFAEEVIESSSGKRFQPTWPFPHVASPLHRGRLVSLDRWAISPASKGRWGKQFEAAGLDLETSALADVALQAGIPWICIRAILDPLREPLFSPRVLIQGIRCAAGKLSVCLKELVEQL